MFLVFVLVVWVLGRKSFGPGLGNFLYFWTFSSEPAKLSIPRPSFDPIHCTICGQGLENFGTYLNHMQLCAHKSLITFDLSHYLVELKSQIELEKFGNFFCVLCPRSFSKIFLLQCHMSSHIHPGYIYFCSICDNTTTTIFLSFWDYIHHYSNCSQRQAASNNENMKTEPPLSIVNGGEWSNFCPYCFTQFSSIR